MKHEVKVTRVLAQSNPEWAVRTVEATSKKKAQEQVLKELKATGGSGWGWTSYADPDLWGKEMVEVS